MSRARWTSCTLLVAAVLILDALPGRQSLHLAGETGNRGAVPPDIERLRVFTKLYGYIRFFHPSDEASGVDWERLAMYGADRALSASASELQGVLESVFLPIAPTLRLYSGDAPPPPHEALGRHAGDSGIEVVAWQHRGVGLGANGPYVSARTHRETVIPARGIGFGMTMQEVKAGPLRDKEVRLRAAVKAEVSGGGRGGLWLRVDRENQQHGFFDNMQDRPITVAEWRVYEIVGRVDADAEGVVLGGLLAGTGRLWLDAFELAVREADGTWRPIELENPGFESSATAIAGWTGCGAGYACRVGGDAFAGARSAILENETTRVSVPLFPETPASEEILQKPLGSGLSCAFPVALPSLQGHTLPAAEVGALGRLRSSLAAFDPAAHAAARRVAAVVVAWNILQHFYPYFDVVAADWDAELTRALQGAMSARSESELYAAMNRLTAALRDGHARAHHAGIETHRAGPLLAFDWIERAVTVVVSEVPEIARGDIVVSVDGMAAVAAMEKDEALISGSPQWRRVQALARFAWGEQGSQVRLRMRRDEREFEVSLARGNRAPLVETRPEAIALLADGIYYVDLSRAAMPEIERRLDALAAARGIVFDMRGYPKGNHDILTHLTDGPIESAKWNVPLILYPDRERIAGWDTSGRWEMKPAAPRLRGRIVFLTDGRAISYAESVMGIVEHYHLGEIVGQPTAGANGNVNHLSLPEGHELVFTGMKVLKHDDSQHHLIGIRPTVPAHRTRAGVAAGRDEFLERALQIINDRC